MAQADPAVVAPMATTSAGGTVTYKWDDSLGCPSGCSTKSLSFSSAETKTATHTMTIGSGGAYWAEIYIDEPNHQAFGQKSFHATCN